MAEHYSAGVSLTGSGGGLVLAPLRGVRYDAERVTSLGAVTSPPYDVVDDDEERRLHMADPHNVVRLILPRGDSERPGERYRHAATLLGEWLTDGVLRVDERPALYVYEQQDADGVQRGLLGALGLRDPADRVILPHEDVLPGPVHDRLELMRATRANLEPILVAYAGRGRATEIVEQAVHGRPLVSATVEGVTHRLWALHDTGAIMAIADDLRPRQAMIADGHHRYATYRRLQSELGIRGPGPWDAGLALLVDTTTYPLRLHAIHRVIDTLDPSLALAKAAHKFRVQQLSANLSATLAALDSAPADGPVFAVAGHDPSWLLSEPDPTWLARSIDGRRPPEVRRLDATVLADSLLRGLWGVNDDDPSVHHEHDAKSAVRHAAAAGGTAVLLRPPTVEQVLTVAAAGATMPRKSTSFGPKPRTGLVLRIFDTP